MSQEEIKEQTGQISRREILKDAGLIVGGATVVSMALVNACGATKTVTSTVAVLVAPQAFTNAMEPTVAPPTIRPASLRNSRLEIRPFFFSSDMVLIIRPPIYFALPSFLSPADGETEVQGAFIRAGLPGPQTIMQNLSFHLLLDYWYSIG